MINLEDYMKSLNTLNTLNMYNDELTENDEMNILKKYDGIKYMIKKYIPISSLKKIHDKIYEYIHTQEEDIIYNIKINCVCMIIFNGNILDDLDNFVYCPCASQYTQLKFRFILDKIPKSDDTIKILYSSIKLNDKKRNEIQKSLVITKTHTHCYGIAHMS